MTLDNFKCQIVSDSMEPVLKIGEVVRAEPIAAPDEVTRLKRFTLIVFKRDDRVLCHYIWRINQQVMPGTCVTRSLKNPFHDEVPVPFNDVLGQIREKVIPTWLRVLLVLNNALRGT